MSKVAIQRDREVSLHIHRLFFKSWMQDKKNFILWAILRPSALLVYHVLIPFQVAYALQAILTRNFAAVPQYAYGVLWLSLLFAVLWAVGGVAICYNGERGQIFIQTYIFDNYISKDYDFFANSHLGALSSQTTRLREAVDEYDQIMFNGFMKQAVIVIASLVIIAWQSHWLALATLAFLIIMFIFTVYIMRWRMKYRRLLSGAKSDTASVISDALSNAATVKSFATEANESKAVNRSVTKLAHLQFISWMTSIPTDVGQAFIMGFGTFAILLITAQLYQNNTISVALVILVQLYVIKLVMATLDVLNLIKSYESTMSSAYQAVQTMLIPAKVIDPESPTKLGRTDSYTIEFKSISHQYPDAQNNSYSVKDLSLHIKPGEKIGLVGFSGSGKTTLTRLLLRFMDCTAGDILINGINIRDITQQDLRSHIAYVPQEPLLFHRTVAENIAYGRVRATNNEVRRVAGLAYVGDFVKDLPKGYKTLVGEKGVKLSGGQRQRVAIARALIKNAPILVLDEATSSLDSESEQYIQKALLNLMKDRTTLVIAHRLSTIKHMDRIVVIDKGSVVQQGTHDELLKNKKGIYARLWKHQTGGYLAKQV